MSFDMHTHTYTHTHTHTHTHTQHRHPSGALTTQRDGPKDGEHLVSFAKETYFRGERNLLKEKKNPYEVFAFLKSPLYIVTLHSIHTRALTFENLFPPRFSKVLYIVTLHTIHTRALTFENFFQVLIFPRGHMQLCFF
jgi:hypothetical protein